MAPGALGPRQYGRSTSSTLQVYAMFVQMVEVYLLAAAITISQRREGKATAVTP